jgi:Uma2 family endonuclease
LNSDSSLPDDREYAGKVYGPAGIPVYWIVNVVDRQVEVYTVPGPAGYASRVDFRPGQIIPFAIGGQQLGEIAVDDLLP